MRKINLAKILLLSIGRVFAFLIYVFGFLSLIFGFILPDRTFYKFYISSY